VLIFIYPNFDMIAYSVKFGGVQRDLILIEYISPKRRQENGSFIHYGIAAGAGPSVILIFIVTKMHSRIGNSMALVLVESVQSKPSTVLLSKIWTLPRISFFSKN